LPANLGISTNNPCLYLALPVMNEPDLPATALKSIESQSYRNFRLFICVNQPDHWWEDPGRQFICSENAETLRILRTRPDITVIDRSSRGMGWKGRHHGVGWARKTLMDAIAREARAEDIIISLDADTFFSENYFSSIVKAFADHPDTVAMAVPYYHPESSDEKATRCMLRYEIYMRYYFLNMHRIGTPYAFTALGSAMASRVSAYRAIGGMTPKLSGEDFYFLQKLRKFGRLLLWNEVTVHPGTRFSDRVFFGTGPAMIKGASGDWTSYPIYPPSLFKEIAATYRRLPELFLVTETDKVIGFMKHVFRESDPLWPLRQNHKDYAHFERAFHEKLDGLRILQFLKMNYDGNENENFRNLKEFLVTMQGGDGLLAADLPDHAKLSELPIDLLRLIREKMFEKEMEERLTSALR